jgi:hypothetical protein
MVEDKNKTKISEYYFSWAFIKNQIPRKFLWSDQCDRPMATTVRKPYKNHLRPSQICDGVNGSQTVMFRDTKKG